MAIDIPVLELEHVIKEYPAGTASLRVLEGVDFTLASGCCAAIVGPSGSGKSTLLNLMGALDTPTSGCVRVSGVDTASLNAREAARLRNRDIGFVFQSHHLLPQCTVLENVLVPSLVCEGGAHVHARALDLLQRVGLADKAARLPGQLSGGERQRTAVVRALINRPRILLADEPTGSLNESGAMHLAELLLELHRQEGMAIVIVTHASAIAARFGATFELHAGRLLAAE